MYSNISISVESRDDYDTDMALEFTETDLNNDYKYVLMYYSCIKSLNFNFEFQRILL